jgi:signal transduction histidine kinase
LENEEVIAAQEQELHKQIRVRAVADERQRFVRDMHDGVGGQLLGLLIRVRSRKLQMDDVENEIQSGLTDLRLVADALDSVGEDIEEALLTFHSRASAQLQAAGIDFIWTNPGQFYGDGLGTRDILNIYRIMQEALVNTIRHANATFLSIRFEGATGQIARSIVVEDDGRGFDPAAIAFGRGLKNMRRRATSLGAELSLTPGRDNRGARLTLSFPKSGTAD